MSNKIIAVYGSLRPGCYNFDRVAGIFGADSIKPLGTHVVKGFALYKVNDSYPGVKKSEHHQLTVDLVEVTPLAYEFIRRMELGANYAEETITVDGVEAIIYTYDGTIQQFNLIKEGDWVNFAKSHEKLKEFYG